MSENLKTLVLHTQLNVFEMATNINLKYVIYSMCNEDFKPIVLENYGF